MSLRVVSKAISGFLFQFANLSIDLALRGTVVLVVAFIVSLVVRKQSAAFRHAFWLTSLIALLLLPASMLLPRWRVLPSWLATPSIVDSVNSDRASSKNGDPDNPANQLSVAATQSEHGSLPKRDNDAAPKDEFPTGRADEIDNTVPADVSQPQIVSSTPKRDVAALSAGKVQSGIGDGRSAGTVLENTIWFATLILVAGSMFVLLRLIASFVWLSRIGRNSKESSAIELLRAEIAAHAKALNVTRPIAVRISPQEIVPMAFGVLRPTLLLPSTICDWSPEKRRAVVLHELSHIARRDPLWQVLVELCGVLFWFHPLFWAARHQCAIAREEACDDLVLNNGMQSDSYAKYLLEIVSQSRRARSLCAVGVATSASSRIEKRIRSILDGSRNRRPLGGRSLTWLLLTVAVIVVPLATIRAVAQDEEPKGTQPGPAAEPSSQPDYGQEPTLQVPAAIGSVEIINVIPGDDVDLTKLSDDELLKRFERAPFGSTDLMTGGGNFFTGDYHAGVAQKAVLWGDRVGSKLAKDETVQEVVRRGDRILAKVHERLRQVGPPKVLDKPLSDWVNPDIIPAYIYVAGTIGNAKSARVIVQAMRNAEPMARGGNAVEISRLYAGTAALGKLTGRPFCMSPDNWDRYLNAVGDDFVSMRLRKNHVADANEVKRALRQLRKDPTNPILARERLIAMGPSVVPALLNELKTADAVEQYVFCIAWILEELGATDQIPSPLRNRYFIHRLSLANPGDHFVNSPDNANQPIEIAARHRLLEHSPLADFVTVALAVDGKLSDSGIAVNMAYWVRRYGTAFNAKFGTAPLRHFMPYKSDARELWPELTNYDDPAAEIAAAVPVLANAVRTMTGKQQRTAVALAEMIAERTAAKPQRLIDALQIAWQQDQLQKDRRKRSGAGQAMAKFKTPMVKASVITALKSADPATLAEAISNVDDAGMTVKSHPDIFKTLAGFVTHENARVRRSAIFALVYRDTESLYPHLAKMARDPDKDIREKAIQVLQRKPNARYVEILFQLAKDDNEFRRQEAVSALGDPEYKASVDRIAKLLTDDKLCGWAASSIVQCVGKDALPLFFAELRRGNDANGLLYQHLERLTGTKLERTPEAWLRWRDKPVNP